MQRSGHSFGSVLTELLKIYSWMIFFVDGGRGHSLYEYSKRLANPRVLIFRDFLKRGCFIVRLNICKKIQNLTGKRFMRVFKGFVKY